MDNNLQSMFYEFMLLKIEALFLRNGQKISIADMMEKIIPVKNLWI